MVKLLLLINGSNLVAEYVGKNAFESTPARVAGSLTEADLYVNSPNQPCVSMRLSIAVKVIVHTAND